MSAWLSEHAADEPGPQWLKRDVLATPAVRHVRRGDGVNCDHARGRGGRLPRRRSLRSSPCSRDGRSCSASGRPEADFGFFASLFRHFASIPRPRDHARCARPACTRWVARIWNLRPERFASATAPTRSRAISARYAMRSRRSSLPISTRTRPPTPRGEKRVLPRGVGRRLSKSRSSPIASGAAIACNASSPR